MCNILNQPEWYNVIPLLGNHSAAHSGLRQLRLGMTNTFIYVGHVIHTKFVLHRSCYQSE